MLNSPLLNAVLGLLLTYALFGLLVSSLQEVIATVLRQRANTLFAGIKQLLNDPGFEGLAQKVYNHALVNPLSDGKSSAGSTPATRPSYIEPDNFALALLDSAQAISSGKTITDLSTLTATVPDMQIRSFLDGVLTRANGDIDKAKADIAAWFNAAMDRLSGDYKRASQLRGLGIALVLALGMNINSVALFENFWRTPTAQQLLDAPDTSNLIATQSSGQNTPAPTLLAQYQLLDELPIGPNHYLKPTCWLTYIGGFLLTALSVLFGAPFWFGLLQNLVNIRGTGNKPATGN